ncbi:MAG: gene transfer agent family protein [Alphaproteobacteria bacterium]|nr:gene transfer agent family protein [Alphaproteobacteria bacterium]
MFNPERGETVVEIGGAPHALRFTLGALAEIERALGAEDPAALAARLKAMRARDLHGVLTAMLRAGGAQAPERLAADAEPASAARAVAACLKANLA